jgi:hypothetical protein
MPKRGDQIAANADEALEALTDRLSRLSYQELVKWADDQLRHATAEELTAMASRSLKSQPRRPRPTSAKTNQEGNRCT